MQKNLWNTIVLTEVIVLIIEVAIAVHAPELEFGNTGHVLVHIVHLGLILIVAAILIGIMTMKNVNTYRRCNATATVKGFAKENVVVTTSKMNLKLFNLLILIHFYGQVTQAAI